MIKQKLMIYGLSIAVTLFGFAACEMLDENVNLKAGKAGFKYKVMVNPNPSKDKPSPPTMIKLDKGKLMVKRVNFEALQQNFHIDHEATVNLLDSLLSNYTLPVIELPSAIYENINFSVESEGITLKGTYINSDGEEVPFKFEYDEPYDIQVSPPDSIKIDESQVNLVLIKLHPKGWFSEVEKEELDTASRDTSGAVVINKNKNVTVYNKAAKGMKKKENKSVEVRKDVEKGKGKNGDDDDDDEDNS